MEKTKKRSRRFRNFYVNLALENAKKINYIKGMADAYLNKGKFHLSHLHSFDIATSSFLQSLKLYESIHDSDGMSADYIQLGVVSYSLQYYQEALGYFKNALECATNKQNRAIANSIYLIALCYSEVDSTKSAINYFSKATNEFRKINDSNGVMSCNIYIAKMNSNIGNNDFAIQSLKEIIAMPKMKNDSPSLSRCFTFLATAYLRKGDYKNAINYGETSYRIGKQSNFFIDIKESAATLAEAYSHLHQYQKAWFYLHESVLLKDSLSNNNVSQRIILMKNKFEYERQTAYSQGLLEHQKLIRNLFIIGALLLFALLIVSFNRYRLKNRSEKQLNKAFEELKHAQGQLVQHEKLASLGSLTAGIAHEINNPINFVSSSISSLKRDVDDLKELILAYKKNPTDAEKLYQQLDIDFTMNEIDELLQGMTEGSNRTTEIIKGLKTFSRTDDAEKISYNIEDGLNSTIMLLSSKLTTKEINLEKKYSALPNINCFGGRINQVFMNIISNAIDACDKKGKIEIKTWKDNNVVKISIADNGHGMTNEIKQKIFDPFFTTKDVGSGTGLGLSITYGIIESHNGKIEVNSVVGKGTEFLITLPIA